MVATKMREDMTAAGRDEEMEALVRTARALQDELTGASGDERERSRQGRLSSAREKDVRRFISAGSLRFSKSKTLHDPLPASPVRHAPANPHPAARDDDDRAFAQRGAVLLDEIAHRVGLLRASEPDEANDAGMGLAA